jgi:adenine deaminase
MLRTGEQGLHRAVCWPRRPADPRHRRTVATYDLLIKNGNVVSPDAVIEADVAVEGERIAGLLKASQPASARRTIDAAGLYVGPGGVDAHVHFDMQFLGLIPSPPEGTR